MRRTTVSQIVIRSIVFLLLPLLIASCGTEGDQRLRIGDRAPDFSISDLQGTLISSDSWRGHPVILRFWDTECKYCRADTPIFNHYFDQYQKRGLKVLYVATGNETLERVQDFIADLEIDFPVALDSDQKVASAYQVTMVPQTVFISPDQKIITAVLGGVSEAELQELIGNYLQ